MDIKDHKYMYKSGGAADPGFSPARNKKIIADTIKKYELMRRRKMLDFKDKLGERTSAVASFLTSDKGPRYARYSNSRIVKYFGKRYLAELQGKKIVERLTSKFQTVKGHSKVPDIVTSSGKLKGTDVRKESQKRPKKKKA